MKQHRSRGQIHLPDVFIVLATFIGLLVLADPYQDFIGTITDNAGPFTTLLLQVFMPLLFIALMLGVGAAARRVA
jgi:hypothetical protein